MVMVGVYNFIGGGKIYMRGMQASNEMGMMVMLKG